MKTNNTNDIMITKNTSRFNPAGLAIGGGIGAALCASSGPAVGISVGIALAVTFSLALPRRR